ncbi:MAG: flagellar basal body rod protein FlgC [Buchnera aphidicola (Chaetogeoica yunlongensis)]
MSLFSIFDIAGSSLIAQSKKMSIHATNLANIDSLIYTNKKLSPYIAKKVILKFNSCLKNKLGGVKIDKIIDDKSPLKSIYNPNSPIADSSGFAKTSNVNLISETIDAITAARDFETNLEMLNTTKNLIMKTLTIGN